MFSCPSGLQNPRRVRECSHNWYPHESSQFWKGMAQILTGIHRTYNRKNVSRLLHQGKDIFSITPPASRRNIVCSNKHARSRHSYWISVYVFFIVISNHGSCVCACPGFRNVSVSNQILQLWYQEGFISKSILGHKLSYWFRRATSCLFFILHAM